MELRDLGFSQQPRSPAVDSGEGLRVNAGAAMTEGGQLRIPLFLAWKLPEPKRNGFARLNEAIVLHVCAGTLKLSRSLADPAYEPAEALPNWTGAGRGHPGSLAAGFLGVTLVLPLPEGPIYLHATLLELQSNLLVLDAAGPAKSFLEGKEHALQLADP